MTVYQKYIKRFFDVFLSSLALIVLSPVFLVTGIAIKLSSPGSVFYYSERAGLHKKPFHFYKFRSMHQTNRDKGMFIADADRVFKVGKIIRKLKIDELPQLINVIKGDMSIVGPRPMVASAVDRLYCGKYEKVADVRPGLTSAASLFDYTVGDSYTDDAAYKREVLPVKLEMELYYVEHESFHYDLDLVWRTIVTILQKLYNKKSFKQQPEYRIVMKEKASSSVAK
ncbi:MAG: sugar transferase [Clostridia bacterium]|nr:sugar transferase [Clostridia bacterium]